MDMRNEFLLQLLQKLGAPLLGAVEKHSTGNAPADANILASLLSECVKISISLSQAMNLKTEDGDANAIRVSLATLAAELVADSYIHKGRAPGSVESKKITDLLQSVIAFADHFTPAAEHSKRLKTIDGAVPFFDPIQTNLYAMHAMVPVISSIAEFSFGQPESKLVQEVADKLKAQAKDLLAALPVGGNEMDELVTLQALGQIYASAHKGQIAKLKQSVDSAPPTMDSVWADFYLRLSMVEVLLKGFAGKQAGAQGSSGGGGIRPSAPQAEGGQEPPAASTASPPAAGGGSPMSFFKKK